jgi:hypothetical protein
MPAFNDKLACAVSSIVRWILFVCAAHLSFAQSGTEPKATPADYPVHAEAGGAGVGAEFMVHSFSRGEESYIAVDYLVVDVALFPPKGQAIEVDTTKFTLRLNGKKAMLFPQSPAMVASSLSHPEWQTRPRPEADLGLGGVNIGLGRPRQTTPFPGAPPESRLPKPSRAPGPDNPGGIDAKERVKPETLVVETALPEGVSRGPVSGYLYFAYQGKAASIKSLELLYEGAVLKLR